MKNISLHWLQGIFETVPYDNTRIQRLITLNTDDKYRDRTTGKNNTHMH